MRQIREWLENKGAYAAGVALYETHGKSRVVLKSLRYGETAFTRATLVRELEKICAQEPDKADKTDTARTRVHVVDTSAERVRETPQPVPIAPADETLGAQRRTLYATRSHLHAQLELLATDAERCQLAADVLAINEKITASYQQQVPAAVVLEEDLQALEAGEARRRLANLRSQASKLKHNPARAGDLARIKATITQLEAKLNRDGESQLHP